MDSEDMVGRGYGKDGVEEGAEEESINSEVEDRWSRHLGQAHNLLNTRTTSSENNPQMKETKLDSVPRTTSSENN